MKLFGVNLKNKKALKKFISFIKTGPDNYDYGHASYEGYGTLNYEAPVITLIKIIENFDSFRYLKM